MYILIAIQSSTSKNKITKKIVNILYIRRIKVLDTIWLINNYLLLLRTKLICSSIRNNKKYFVKNLVNSEFRIGGLHVMNRILVDKLGLVPPYDDFMAFRELFISAGQDGIFETHMLTISKLNKVLKVNMFLTKFIGF